MYVKYVCTHTHIYINTKALPNKAQGCWELCHKERWRLEVTKSPAPSTSEKQEPSQSPVSRWLPRMEPAGKEMSGVQGFVCFLTTPGVRTLKLRWPLF